MNKILCIYRANDADSLGAAWAVHRALGDGVEFVAAKEGEQHELLTSAECVASGNCLSQKDIPGSCNICDGGLGYCKKCHRAEIELDQPCGIPSVEGRDILILGLSYPLATLRAMVAEARSVLVIDHRKEVEQDLVVLPQPTALGKQTPASYLDFLLEREREKPVGQNLAALFDKRRSTAGIAWAYFNPQKRTEKRSPSGEMAYSAFEPVRPRIINLIEDYALGCPCFGDESRAFYAVLMSYDIADLPAMFGRLAKWDDYSEREGAIGPIVCVESSWQRLLDEGRAILRAQRQAEKRQAEAKHRSSHFTYQDIVELLLDDLLSAPEPPK